MNSLRNTHSPKRSSQRPSPKNTVSWTFQRPPGPISQQSHRVPLQRKLFPLGRGHRCRAQAPVKSQVSARPVRLVSLSCAENEQGPGAAEPHRSFARDRSQSRDFARALLSHSSGISISTFPSRIVTFIRTITNNVRRAINSIRNSTHFFQALFPIRAQVGNGTKFSYQRSFFLSAHEQFRHLELRQF